jgi:hypothetical protein
VTTINGGGGTNHSDVARGNSIWSHLAWYIKSCQSISNYYHYCKLLSPNSQQFSQTSNLGILTFVYFVILYLTFPFMPHTSGCQFDVVISKNQKRRKFSARDMSYDLWVVHDTINRQPSLLCIHDPSFLIHIYFNFKYVHLSIIAFTIMFSWNWKSIHCFSNFLPFTS